MLESVIEKRVCQYATQSGILSYKFTSPSNRAVCDRIFIRKGAVFFIEFKAKGKKPTALQSRHHEQLRSYGISVYVVDSVEQGKKVIDDEAEKSRKGHSR